MKRFAFFLLLAFTATCGKAFSQSLDEFLKVSQKNKAVLFEDTALKVKPKQVDPAAYNKWIKDNNKRYQDFSKISMGDPITVTVAVLLDDKGSLVATAVSQGVGFGFDEEAVRLIKENPNKWNPGKVNGKPVFVELRYQVDFVNNKNFFAKKDNHKIFKQY